MTILPKVAEDEDLKEKINELKAILALLEYAAQRAGEIDQEASQAAIDKAAVQVAQDLGLAMTSSS